MHSTQTENDESERAKALAAMGLYLERPQENAEAQNFYLWPDHVPAFALWHGVATQWRYGWNGRTGLDYMGVRAAPAFRALAREQREPVFAELCVMERAALAEWAALRAEAESKKR